MLALKAHDNVGLAPNIALYGDARNDFFLAFNVITGEQFSLNSTSFWVMESIMKSMEWAKLRESFFRKFELERSRSDKDLDRLASQLLELGLVEIKGGEKQ
ncbi:MAG: hypothetical protein V1932_02220 [Chloroflexota bacterium]